MNEITLIRQAGPEAHPLSPAARHNARSALLAEIATPSRGRADRPQRTETKKRFTVRLALTATAAAAALTVAAVISTPQAREAPGASSTSITLVAFEPVSFPFTLDPLPAGLVPFYSADPGDRLIAAYQAPHGDDGDEGDAAEAGDEGVTVVITPSKPDVAGASDTQKVTVQGRSAELMVENYIEAAGANETVERQSPVLVLPWSANQWVEISGRGRFQDADALLALGQTLVERPQAVPLQVHLAPAGWTMLAYKDNYILTLANDTDDQQELTVLLPEAPVPADKLLSLLDRPVSPVLPKTVNNRPAQLVQVDPGWPGKAWYLQAQFPNGRTFVVMAPGTFTPEQILTVAAEVTYRP